MEVITEEMNQSENPEYMPKTIKGVVERSYIQHREDEEKNLDGGEFLLADVSVAVSQDRDNNTILDIVSVNPELVEIVENALCEPYTLRKNIIELPMEEMERIARIEAVDILSYLQKLEKARIDEKERLLNYEEQLANVEIQ